MLVEIGSHFSLFPSSSTTHFELLLHFILRFQGHPQCKINIHGELKMKVTKLKWFNLLKDLSIIINL